MARAIEDIANDIRGLTADEKRVLLRSLIDELDAPADPEVEKAWLETAQRRFLEIQDGTVRGVPGEEVMDRVRALLRK